MSTEDLMKPRYKVIAPNGYHYPNSPFKDGEILEWQSLGVYIIRTREGVNSFYDRHPENYPHLFKPLAWWEDRKPEEMPEYIRFIEPLPERFSIWKVNEWRMGLKHPLVKTDCDIVWRELSICDLPATETEYTSYINSKVK